MRPTQSTLSAAKICACATDWLLPTLASLGWVAGAAPVEPLFLLRLLLRASAARRSLHAIASRLKDGPCAQTIRNALTKLLPDNTAALEPAIAQALHQRLPRSLKRRSRTMAIDLHTKPFYGDKKAPGTYRGQPKASTRTFFAYATLLVIRKGQSFTVGLVPVVNSDDLCTLIERLLLQAAQQGLQPRRLLLDRGFYAGKVMLYLQNRNIPFVMPMIRRGKSGQTKKDCTGTAQFFVKGRRGWATYRWETRPRSGGRKGPKGERTAVTTEVCMVPPPGQGKQVPWVYACYRMKHWTCQDIARLYRRRFRIETSYRQMRQGLAQTSSKNPVYRLLLVLLALVLRNVWVWLHLTRLAGRGKDGTRVLRLHLMRAGDMLYGLSRYLDAVLGILINFVIPSPASAGG